MLTIDEQIKNKMLMDALEGPPTVYMVFAKFSDGTFQMYAFDEEDTQVWWAEHLAVNAKDMSVEHICFTENLLNATDSDDWLFTIH